MNPEFQKLAEKERDQEIQIILELKAKANRIQTQIAEHQDTVGALDKLLISKLKEEPSNESPQFISVAGMGFRDAVRALLRAASYGLTTGEIREHLLASGYIYEAATPLPIRISNEMRRMKEQGIMIKEGKKYLLTKKGWNM